MTNRRSFIKSSTAIGASMLLPGMGARKSWAHRNRPLLDAQSIAKPMAEGTTGGMLSDIRLRGAVRPPEANETGPKDTVLMYPGQVTRIAAKFTREGEYVWHCHILSHEDHEMMRPYQVVI